MKNVPLIVALLTLSACGGSGGGSSSNGATVNTQENSDRNSVFTVSEGNFPQSLRVRFTPKQSLNVEGTSCESAEGLLETNGRINSYNAEIDYNGYATTTAGYRWDVDMDIDTDTGEIDGTYKYDPLGVSGVFDGDIYYAVTTRAYLASWSSYDTGCEGVWQLATKGGEFPALSIEPVEIQDDSVSKLIEVNEAGYPLLLSGGYSNDIPNCEQARERILASVNPMMTQAEVLQAVGRPFTIGGVYGTDWNYGGIGSRAQIEFSYDNGIATVVEGYDVGTTACNDSTVDLQLIENANQLASQQPNVDYTNEIPSCYDAATRIAAWVRPNMTQEQVRKIVGKPKSIGGVYGTDWVYGDYGINVSFRYDDGLATSVEGHRIWNLQTCLNSLGQ